LHTLTSKIKPLEACRGVGGILCHGCFDILHIGHIRHLSFARALSSKMPLIVTITADAYIRKGRGRPVFNQHIRAEVLAAIEMIDIVAIVDEATGLTPITIIHPTYYVKGEEYADPIGINGMEQRAVKQYGGHLVYTARFYSSTEVLAKVISEH
jgi:rfaE bifunctional protein nucleotidyltransferase chain/domain